MVTLNHRSVFFSLSSRRRHTRPSAQAADLRRRMVSGAAEFLSDFHEQRSRPSRRPSEELANSITVNYKNDKYRGSAVYKSVRAKSSPVNLHVGIVDDGDAAGEQRRRRRRDSDSVRQEEAVAGRERRTGQRH